jgi:hypothetical protein
VGAARITDGKGLQISTEGDGESLWQNLELATLYVTLVSKSYRRVRCGCERHGGQGRIDVEVDGRALCLI